MTTLATPGLYSEVMVLHHVTSALIAAAHVYPHLLLHGGDRPWGQYDLVFFYGVMELSTVPLAVHDALKVLPNHLVRVPRLRSLNKNCKALFAALFLTVRCVWFPVVLKGYWACIETQLANHTSSAPLLLYGVLVAAVFMAMLQMFWGFKILEKLWDMLEEESKKLEKRD